MLFLQALRCPVILYLHFLLFFLTNILVFPVFPNLRASAQFPQFQDPKWDLFFLLHEQYFHHQNISAHKL